MPLLPTTPNGLVRILNAPAVVATVLTVENAVADGAALAVATAVSVAQLPPTTPPGSPGP